MRPATTFNDPPATGGYPGAIHSSRRFLSQQHRCRPSSGYHRPRWSYVSLTGPFQKPLKRLYRSVKLVTVAGSNGSPEFRSPTLSPTQQAAHHQTAGGPDNWQCSASPARTNMDEDLKLYGTMKPSGRSPTDVPRPRSSDSPWNYTHITFDAPGQPWTRPRSTTRNTGVSENTYNGHCVFSKRGPGSIRASYTWNTCSRSRVGPQSVQHSGWPGYVCRMTGRLLDLFSELQTGELRLGGRRSRSTSQRAERAFSARRSGRIRPLSRTTCRVYSILARQSARTLS
jgi:hypothetical protein